MMPLTDVPTGYLDIEAVLGVLFAFGSGIIMWFRSPNPISAGLSDGNDDAAV